MSMVGSGGDGGHHNDNQIYPSPPPQPSSHLLEVTIISAQDLHPATCLMAAYASAWVDSKHKLNTHIDTTGRINPSWNDKFVFRIDESFLRSDTSAVTINIIASTTFRKDLIVGTTRVVLSALNPSPSTRFVALQVRRPKSLRPQGIINVGVSLLDAYIHSMPLDPAFVLKDIVGTPNRSFSGTSYGSMANESNEEWKRGNENGEEWKLERMCSVEVGRGVGEQEADELESKLEKWRMDLSPLHDLKPKKHRRSMTAPCFCGSSVKD